MKILPITADAYQLLHDGALALARAEQHGIRVDLDYCERTTKRLTRRIERARRQLEESSLHETWRRMFGARTNMDSRHQLSRVLYEGLKIEPPKRTQTGRGATDDEALRSLVKEIPELRYIQDIARLTKLRDTYLAGFIRNQHAGYLHPTFNLHTVISYRSSSSDPNFQNIPRRDKEAMRICRRALYPRPGHTLMEADFASLEVMISACYHEDPTMLRYLEGGGDMHLDMATQIFFLKDPDRSKKGHNHLREAAKNGFVFPQFYGDYYGNNARSLAEWAQLPQQGRWRSGQGVEIAEGVISDHMRAHGVRSFEDFTSHMKSVEQDFWGRRFRVYSEWKDRWLADYRRKGYFQMFTGFVCQGALRTNQIINMPVQGTAFHCLLRTFIEVDRIIREKKWRSRLIGQIHDSMVLDVHPDEIDLVQEAIHGVVQEFLPSLWDWIIVPLEIEIDIYGVDHAWLKEDS